MLLASDLAYSWSPARPPPLPSLPPPPLRASQPVQAVWQYHCVSFSSFFFCCSYPGVVVAEEEAGPSPSLLLLPLLPLTSKPTHPRLEQSEACSASGCRRLHGGDTCSCSSRGARLGGGPVRSLAAATRRASRGATRNHAYHCCLHQSRGAPGCTRTRACRGRG